jgi:anaerobic selenocysteine-containing dehydrogenase
LIDPGRSRSTVLADSHIAPRPGADVYLAMAAARRVLAAGAEDRDFLENHAVGVKEYLDILARFEVDELCRLSGVSRAEAELLARTLMAERPASILLGWGLHRPKTPITRSGPSTPWPPCAAPSAFPEAA